MIQPHAGPQTAFLSTPADVAIYGGAAGGGKTWGIVAEAVRHVGTPGYGATIFRRTATQVTNQGGLWDETMKLYPLLGGEPRPHMLEWTFPSGATVKFRHLQYEQNKLDHQGAQIAMLAFDELTHFSESQFWYMFSRNRSLCGVRPYIRATTNPDASSWVSRLIQWWIDPDTGYAIPERSGVLRWFFRVNDQLEWFGTREEALRAAETIDAGLIPKSLTFIPAKLTDNPTLTRADPGYLANLLALQYVDRERLLGGNWKIVATAGNVFKREWFPPERFVKVAPEHARRVRYWDKAGGEKATSDRSAGVKMAFDGHRLYVEHAIFGRWSPHDRNKVIASTARLDNCPSKCDLWVEKEPGHNAKEVTAIHAREWAQFAPRFDAVTSDKVVRSKPFSAQCEAGNVYIVEGAWNQELIDELVNFPPENNGHDDIVDACSGACNKLIVHGEQRPAVPPVGFRPGQVRAREPQFRR